jgi:hypothetical protein
MLDRLPSSSISRTLVGGIGMEQQVHLRRRFIAVLGDVELVDAVAVAAIETDPAPDMPSLIS